VLDDQHQKMEEDIQKERNDKEEKIQKMRSNIDMIKAERKKTIDAEHDYRMIQKPITYFPFTHGDTVDAARMQIREEMQNDLKDRIAMIE